ncbi:MAG: alpha/beta hydrolase [Notoacmeibacter sp.]|nr:alpha/beta hydrolase [Notoacmeibacter sp.]
MTSALVADRDRFAALHPERRIVVNGRDWGMIAAGSQGPSLLLIPGTLGRADIFWQQIEALQDRARIVSLSYPEKGGVAEWAGDLAKIVSDYLGGKATVLGSSLGGYVVQYFAAVHPDLTERLIAANTLSSVADIRTRPPYSSDLDNGPIGELRAGFGIGLRAWGEMHPEQADLVELLMAEQGGRIPEAELRARLNALKHGPELPAVKLPNSRIATVEAADDPLIPAPMREAVRARLEPGRAYRFAAGGHFPYVARPAEYTALLEEQIGLQATGAVWPEGATTEL